MSAIRDRTRRPTMNHMRGTHRGDPGGARARAENHPPPTRHHPRHRLTGACPPRAPGDNFYNDGCYANDNLAVNASLRCANRFQKDW